MARLHGKVCAEACQCYCYEWFKLQDISTSDRKHGEANREGVMAPLVCEKTQSAISSLCLTQQTPDAHGPDTRPNDKCVPSHLAITTCTWTSALSTGETSSMRSPSGYPQSVIVGASQEPANTRRVPRNKTPDRTGLLMLRPLARPTIPRLEREPTRPWIKARRARQQHRRGTGAGRRSRYSPARRWDGTAWGGVLGARSVSTEARKVVESGDTRDFAPAMEGAGALSSSEVIGTGATETCLAALGRWAVETTSEGRETARMILTLELVAALVR